MVSSKSSDCQVSSAIWGNPTTQLAEQEKGVVTLGDELLFDDENVGCMVVLLGNDDVELAELGDEVDEATVELEKLAEGMSVV